ncbi:MAG: ISAs1 family transposase [Archangium sp.]|nr:ISAs1 family transposase [Archangium sp.]
MKPEAVRRVFEHFAELEDPRIKRTRRHELLHVLVMTLCGAIAGADGWEALAAFSHAKRKWFEGLFDLPNGTPSADTFRRVLCALEPREFEKCFRKWVDDVAASFKGEVIALDGKSLRGAVDHAGSTSPLHLMQVWATKQRLVLAQRAVDGAAGEPAAIPELLKLLDLEGAVVTSDANGCTAATTVAVREAGADYLVALKGNRGPQYKHVRNAFETADLKEISASSKTNKGHGRIETRTVYAMPAFGWTWADWRDVKTFVMIERRRLMVGAAPETETVEVGFYLTSLPPKATALSKRIRAHWGIENGLNWVLDVSFGEDRQLIRDRRGAENFAIITRLAHMLLRNEKTAKYGSTTKRKRAGWDDDYLALVLTRGLTEDS